MKEVAGRLLSRRELLDWTTKLTLVALAGAASGCTRAPTASCSDPKTLSDAELELRKSLAYAEEGPNPAQRCGGCAFFKASDDSACGVCAILHGPVNPQGHCTSWAAAS